MKQLLNVNISGVFRDLRIKKLFRCTAVIFLSMIVLMSGTVNAASSDDKHISVIIDGKNLSFPDAAPFIDTHGRILVPAKYIGEGLGANISWDAETLTATLTKGSIIVTIKIGESVIRANGSVITMDTQAAIYNQRTYLPIRFIAQALGNAVSYDAATMTAYINSSGPTAASVAVLSQTADYFSRISVGDGYFMAILDDNSLWGWGCDNNTHLGLRYNKGGVTSVGRPAKIMGDAKAVFTGKNQTLVIKTNGELWGWGEDMPSVGEDRLTFSLKPEHIMDNVVSACCGEHCLMAVTSDGKLWAWGSNVFDGKLYATYTYSDFITSTTKPAYQRDGIKQVVSGCVLTVNGELEDWRADSPDYATVDTDVKSLLSGGYYIKTDGSLWNRGNVNGKNKVGDNITFYGEGANCKVQLNNDGKLTAVSSLNSAGSSVDLSKLSGEAAKEAEAIIEKMNGAFPIPFTSIDNVRSVSMNGSTGLALKQDGTVLAWGDNSNGYIGEDFDKNVALKEVTIKFSASEPALFTNPEPNKSKLLSDYESQAEEAKKLDPPDSSGNNSWTGYWSTSMGSSDGFDFIEQKGNNVELFLINVRDQSRPILQFWGKVDGNKIKGYRQEGGIFELTLSKDGKSFKGYVFGDSEISPSQVSGKFKKGLTGNEVGWK